VIPQIRTALRAARAPIGIMTATYLLSVGTGAVMVHSDNAFALAFRDSLVARAHRADPSARADDAGHHLQAATLDFSRNLGLAAIPETIGGLLLVVPVAMGAYRGWVGGIVSVDAHHRSRLAQPRSAAYFLVTLTLQLIGFTLAGAAGLHLGWSFFKKRGPFVGPAWFRLPGPALRDVGWLYAIIIPMFAIGSLWEFLGPS
jgi:hypothetical protein